jgi:phage shock protein A
MPIRRRITAIFRSTRTGPEAAEDPLRALDTSYQEQLDLLDASRRSTADVAAHHRRVQLLAEQAAAETNRLNRAAEAAVAAGDDAAREALRGALAAGKRLDVLSAQQRTLEGQLHALEQALGRLEQRLEDVRLHQLALKARHSAARAALGMQDALRAGGQGAADVHSAAAAAEREVRRLQALAAAREELAWSDPDSLQVREAFEELEERPADTVLSRLKDARTEPPDRSGR